MLNGQPKVGQKRNSQSFCGERAVFVYGVRSVAAHCVENEHRGAGAPDRIDNRRFQSQGQEFWIGF
jgi:hypothetical protein